MTGWGVTGRGAGNRGLIRPHNDCGLEEKDERKGQEAQTQKVIIITIFHAK